MSYMAGLGNMVNGVAATESLSSYPTDATGPSTFSSAIEWMQSDRLA